MKEGQAIGGRLEVNGARLKKGGVVGVGRWVVGCGGDRGPHLRAIVLCDRMQT